MLARLLAPALVAVAVVAPAAPAGPVYTIDILSSEYYPQLRDAWMFKINNNGVAGGYIATASVGGPYLPTTYAGPGRFAPIPGLQSDIYQLSVTGIADDGTVTGLLLDAAGNFNAYVARDGSVRHLPAGTWTNGMTAGGTAYGYTFDPVTFGDTRAATVRDGVVTEYALSAGGFTNFLLTGGNDRGLFSVDGYSADFSQYGVFVYDAAADALAPLAAPADFPNPVVGKVLADGRVAGGAYSADFSEQRYGFWNPDGSFGGFLDTPAGLTSVRFNDAGRAVGLVGGVPYFYDGTSWTAGTVAGLNGYTLSGIDDYNNRGQFVGLVSQPGGGFAWGYVASPVPEPASLGLLASGGLGLLGYARRRRAGRASVLGLALALTVSGGGSARADEPKPQEIAGWGTVVDPDGDCTLIEAKGALSVKVPGTLHDLYPLQKNRKARANAPRVVREVTGDFTAAVKVSADWKPGGKLPGSTSYPFNGAGLVVYASDGDFVRLERNLWVGPTGPVSYTAPIHYAGGVLANKPGSTRDEFFKGRSTWLKVERAGQTLTTWVSHDGKEWTETAGLATAFPEAVRVGVVAVNSSDAAFAVTFEGLTVAGK